MFETFRNTHAPEARTSCYPKQLKLNGHVVIQSCSLQQFPGSWYTQDTILLFITRGTMQLRYGGETFELIEGQLCLLRKNILLECATPKGPANEALEYFQFIIKYDLVKEFMKLVVLPRYPREHHPPVVTAACNGTWLTYLYSLESYLTQPSELEPALVRLKMLELLFNIFTTDKRMFVQLTDLHECYRTNITATVEENIMNSLSVSQLARLSGRSRSSFRRDFIAIYNMPPSQWIRVKRLEKARELLLGTTMSVTDICYTLGFEHIAHFSKLFKSHFGFPPSDYKVNSIA